METYRRMHFKYGFERRTFGDINIFSWKRFTKCTYYQMYLRDMVTVTRHTS